MESNTDYEKLKNMTEEETRKTAESNQDLPLQSEKDLKRFRPVKNENL